METKTKIIKAFEVRIIRGSGKVRFGIDKQRREEGGRDREKRGKLPRFSSLG